MVPPATRSCTSSLAAGPKHGYAMMLDVRTFAGFELGPGTLYSAITRLVENGWVKPQEARGRQRPYQLTSSGLQLSKPSSRVSAS